MEYFISITADYFIVPVIDKYEDNLLQFMKDEFVFKTSEFDDFIIVLQVMESSLLGKYGKDRLQVSKSEKTIFLGVNLINENFKMVSAFNEDEFNYIKYRILEVKNDNLNRLLKNGLIR